MLVSASPACLYLLPVQSEGVDRGGRKDQYHRRGVCRECVCGGGVGRPKGRSPTLIHSAILGLQRFVASLSCNFEATCGPGAPWPPFKPTPTPQGLAMRCVCGRSRCSRCPVCMWTAGGGGQENGVVWKRPCVCMEAGTRRRHGGGCTTRAIF